MRPGDEIVMTKWAALEGTSILAEDYEDRLASVPASLLDKARSLSGSLSIVPESRIALSNGATAMHDVTEGGILGAAWELGVANACAVAIETNSIPVRDETRAVCGALGLDPLRLIGSGSPVDCLQRRQSARRSAQKTANSGCGHRPRNRWHVELFRWKPAYGTGRGRTLPYGAVNKQANR